MDGRMDVRSRALCPNLNHHLRVYSWVVVLKWAVQEMFGQRVKQRAAQDTLSVQINLWKNSVCHCRSWWRRSLRTWQPPDTFNWWGPKWGKGQWMRRTQSPSLPLANTLFHSSPPLPHWFPPGYWSIPHPFHWTRRSHRIWRGLIRQEWNDI